MLGIALENLEMQLSTLEKIGSFRPIAYLYDYKQDVYVIHKNKTVNAFQCLNGK